MSFLLDTDICSAYLKNNRAVIGKVMLHWGGLSMSVVTVGELLTWGSRRNAPARRMLGIRDLLTAATIIEVNMAVAEKYAEIRAPLPDQGLDPGPIDLLNASIALIHNMTMVTHNLADYVIVPGLVIEDWQVP